MHAGFFGTESASILEIPGRQHTVSEVWSQVCYVPDAKSWFKGVL
jgi:hypothetical protein